MQINPRRKTTSVPNEGKINAGWELLKWFFGLSKHTFAALGLVMMEYFPPAKLGDENDKRSDRWVLELKQTLKETLGSDGVFLYPTHPLPPNYHGQPLSVPYNFSYTAIINILGLPSTHCPLGLSREGVPIGLQVVGGSFNDHLTIAVANELEKEYGGWVCPSKVV